MVLLLKLFCLHFSSCLDQYIHAVPWLLWDSHTLFLKRGKSGFVVEEQHLVVKKWICGHSGFYCSADGPVHGSPSASSMPSVCPGMANYSGLLWTWGKLAEASFPHPEEGLQDPKLLKMLENNTWYLFMVSWFPGPTDTIVPLCCS